MFELVFFFIVVDYVFSFVSWLESLTIWEIITIVAFTVAIDISRNIVKCIVVITDEIKKRYKPRQLNLLRKPKISILIPAHNESSAIKKTIMSILENQYPNKEIIVIDDHSTDDTYEQALPFQKRGLIKVVKRTIGKGSKSGAINYGSMYATGDYIMVMDSDTLIQKDALEEIAKYVNLPDVVAVSGNVRILSGDDGISNILTRCQSYEYLISLELGRRYNALMRMLLIIPGAFGVFSKETGRKIGLYDKDTLTEDFDLTIKLIKLGGRIEFVPNAIAYTYCPNNWKAWIRQRIRWAHGQLSTIIKHQNALKSSAYKRTLRLALYDMIIMDIILLIVRMAAIIWLAFIFSESVLFVYTLIFILYFVNEFIVIGAAIALSPNKSDIKYIYLAPFVVTVYRPIYTYVRFYAYLLRFLGKEPTW